MNLVVLMDNGKDYFVSNFLRNFESRRKENWRAIIACYEFKLLRWNFIKGKSERDYQVQSTLNYIIHIITFSIIKDSLIEYFIRIPVKFVGTSLATNFKESKTASENKTFRNTIYANVSIIWNQCNPPLKRFRHESYLKTFKACELHM